MNNIVLSVRVMLNVASYMATYLMNWLHVLIQWDFNNSSDIGLLTSLVVQVLMKPLETFRDQAFLKSHYHIKGLLVNHCPNSFGFILSYVCLQLKWFKVQVRLNKWFPCPHVFELAGLVIINHMEVKYIIIN